MSRENYERTNGMRLRLLAASLALLCTANLALADSPQYQHYNAAAQDTTRLLFADNEIDPTRESWNLPPDLIGETGASRLGNRYRLVQFHAHPTVAEVSALKSSGWEVMAVVPTTGLILRGTGSDDASLRSNSSIRWIGQLEPGLKVSRRLLTKLTSAEAAEGTHDILVTMWPGEDRKALAIELEDAGFDVLSAPTHSEFDASRLMVRLPAGAGLDLAKRPEVQFIEPRPIVTDRNTSEAGTTQSGVEGSFPIWAHGLHGEGQIVGHIDGGIGMTHCFFQDPANNTVRPEHRKVVRYGGTLSADGHGTHTAGTAAGKNSSGDLTEAGHAYEAKLSHAKTSTVTGWDNATSNLGATFLAAQNTGAFVHTNSWGEDFTTEYTTFCADIDSFSYANEDGLVVFAATNQDDLFTPENAKNVLAVGNSMKGNSGQNQHSTGGIGPTADGRRKPEIYAPGTSTVSATTSGCSTTGSGFTGTSMATPAITGNAALIRQYYTEGFYPNGVADKESEFIPSGALIKATLLNGTVDMTGITGYPSNLEGWGRLLMDNVLYFDGDPRSLWVADERFSADNGLAQAEFVEYQLAVLDPAQPLKVTLAWMDPPVAFGTNFTPVNNLNLTVTAPGGSSFKGNVFTAGVSSTGGTADNINNVEMVLINNPAVGTYTIRVDAATVSAAFHEQGYAVVASGALGASARGQAFFDADKYACGSEIALTVRDANGPAALLQVVVTTTKGDSETLDLVQGEDGAYTGVLSTSLDRPTTDDGVLQGASGDTITMSYSDEDTGNGAEVIVAECELDCEGPSFESVVLSDIIDVRATLTVTMSEELDGGEVIVGRNCGGEEIRATLNATETANVYTTTINGLTEATIYFISGEATDTVGNPGALVSCVEFTTLLRESELEADFEPEGDDFTLSTPTGGAVNGWRLVESPQYATSPTHAFHSPSFDDPLDAILLTPQVRLPDEPLELTFYHTFEFEAGNWDGGVLEVKTGIGGNNWVDASTYMTQGGYNGTIRTGSVNPLTGRNGWVVGSLGVPTKVTLDLAPLVGQVVQFRFRQGCDGAIASTGWFVDDVMISRLVVPPPPTATQSGVIAY